MQRSRPIFVDALPECQVEAELEEHRRGYHVLCLCKFSIRLPYISAV